MVRQMWLAFQFLTGSQQIMLAADMLLHVASSGRVMQRRGAHRSMLVAAHPVVAALADISYCNRSKALQRAANSLEATANWLKQYTFLSKEDMQIYRTLVSSMMV